jgi:hypothetical protein
VETFGNPFGGTNGNGLFPFVPGAILWRITFFFMAVLLENRKKQKKKHPVLAKF